jgi:hypothetical protein
MPSSELEAEKGYLPRGPVDPGDPLFWSAASRLSEGPITYKRKGCAFGRFVRLKRTTVYSRNSASLLRFLVRSHLSGFACE